MMTSAGMIRGYCAIWNESSVNMAARNEASWYETIASNALVPAADLFLDAHHFEPSACAFRSDGTLQVGVDGTGFWFQAELAPTANGFDVIGGLREFCTLPVSFTMIGGTARWDTREGERVRTVSAATIISISIMKPGMAAYPATRSWIVGAELRDQQARMLAQKFASRRPTPSTSPAGSSSRGKIQAAAKGRPSADAEQRRMIELFAVARYSASQWQCLLNATARNLSRTAGR